MVPDAWTTPTADPPNQGPPATAGPGARPDVRVAASPPVPLPCRRPFLSLSLSLSHPIVRLRSSWNPYPGAVW